MTHFALNFPDVKGCQAQIVKFDIDALTERMLDQGICTRKTTLGSQKEYKTQGTLVDPASFFITVSDGGEHCVPVKGGAQLMHPASLKRAHQAAGRDLRQQYLQRLGNLDRRVKLVAYS